MARSRSAVHRLVGVLVALAALAGLGLLGGPAFADGGQIGLSNDGVSFGTHLARPIFPTQYRWVPGDVMVRSFYVRNQSQDSGDLTILLGDQTASMARSGDLKVATRLPGRAWDSLGDPAATDPAPMAIGPGDQTRIDVQVTFVGSSTNASQLLGTDVGLVVNLSQAVDQVAAPHDNVLGMDVPVLGDPGFQLLLLALGSAAVYALRRHRVRNRSEEPRHA